MKRYYLVVTPFFPTSDSFRGPFIYDQVRALKDVSDYEIIVFKPTGIYDKNLYYDYDGIRVNLFHYRQSPSYLFNGFFNRANAKNFINAVKRLSIEPQYIVAVHCHTSSFGACGLELKKLNHNIKVILQHHDKDPFTIMNGKFSNWKINARYRARKNIEIFKNVDIHVPISSACEANLLSFPNASPQETYLPYLSKMPLFNGLKSIKPKQSIILYNGVDVTKFYQKQGSKSPYFTIGCIGNFIHLKGQRDLIIAVHNWVKRSGVTDIQLIFVGSGPTLKACKELVANLNMSKYVEFRQEVHHKYLIDFYNSLDLFVLPSYFDGFGCVCLEAAACGVPYIISENQGAAEYIIPDDSEHWLYPAGNKLRLSELIEDFYSTRRQQSLRYSIDIRSLVSDFLTQIGI